MEDRFKFRIWDKENGKWCEEKIKFIDDEGNVLVGINDTDIYYLCRNEDDLIVEKCTGLKDEKGNLIYEGDIIKVEDNFCEITYDMDNARYNVSGYGEIAYLNYNDIKVVGNIHENPELLGDNK